MTYYASIQSLHVCDTSRTQPYLISESSLFLGIGEELDGHDLLVPPGSLDAAERSALRKLLGGWRKKFNMQSALIHTPWDVRRERKILPTASLQDVKLN